jgi:predicted MFS family arabinose efflux permease
VTVPAVVAAIASPALAVASGRLDRRLVLLLMAGLFTVSDALSATPPNFAMLRQAWSVRCCWYSVSGAS